MAATTDPAPLPPLATRSLTINRPRPGSPRAADAPFAPADPAAVGRLDALRHWVEQGDTQAKHELGWADVRVRWPAGWACCGAGAGGQRATAGA
ncbi:MAG TPA: hypothetical protein VGL23_03775 [Chloroflexota bacterium]